LVARRRARRTTAEYQYRGAVANCVGLYLLFSLKTHPKAFASVETESLDEEAHSGNFAVAIGSLVGASVLAAWMSEILVGAAEGRVRL
jgi:Ca2+:H+ antiporter